MNRNWTEEEIIVALNLYCKIPFKAISSRHPLIQEYAKIVGRSPSALSMKMGNLGRLDPALREKGIVGLSQGSKLDEVVWNKFIDNPEELVYESEKIIAKLKAQSIEKSVGIDAATLPLGEEREYVIRQRVNQQFFRTAVLCSYNNRCCMTGITQKGLLEACHISPWSEDVKNRTNPENGLSMNPLFHKAFDDYLISISPDYIISISDRLIETTLDERFSSYLVDINGKPIYLPEKFYPNKAFLDMHYSKYKQTL